MRLALARRHVGWWGRWFPAVQHGCATDESCQAPRRRRPILLAATLAHAAECAVGTSVEIAATLDQACQAWTMRDGITGFVGPGTSIEPRVGGAVRIRSDPGAQHRGLAARGR
jgi:hypothetical protein